MSIPGLITELYMPVNLSLNRSKGKVLLNSILYPLVSFRTLNLEDLKKTLYSPFPHPSPVPLLLLHLEFKLNKKSCSYFINFLTFFFSNNIFRINPALFLVLQKQLIFNSVYNKYAFLICICSSKCTGSEYMPWFQIYALVPNICLGS